MPKKDVTKKEKKHFFKDFKAELKRVIWPTPKQLVNSTVAVIVIVLITAAIVFALDLVFEFANKFAVDNIKHLVNTNNEQVDTNTNTQIENAVDNVLNNSEVDNNTVNE